MRMVHPSLKILFLLGALAFVFHAGCSLSLWKKDRPSERDLNGDLDKDLATDARVIWTDNYAEAMGLSFATQTPVLAWFTGSDWCSWCIRLEEEVFSTPEFAEWADRNVICLEVDFPRQKQLAEQIVSQNELLRQKYEEHVNGFPTVLFLDPNGMVLGSLGYESGGTGNWVALADEKLGSPTSQ